MEDSNLNYTFSLHERIAVLETQMKDLAEIRGKLDQLLELKARGMGAMGLVGLVIGSGVLGLFATFFSLFRAHNHL